MVIVGEMKNVERVGDKLWATIHFKQALYEYHEEVVEYDRIILCAGFRFN